MNCVIYRIAIILAEFYYNSVGSGCTIVLCRKSNQLNIQGLNMTSNKSYEGDLQGVYNVLTKARGKNYFIHSFLLNLHI